MPEVARAMKNARAIVQYFNKSTQATKKLMDQQRESSLVPKYFGKPLNILQDVKTRWWSTYHMLKMLRFLREAISHYVVDNPHDSDVVNLTHQEWRLCHQVEITLQTMAFWQRVLEGEKYVTGSLVPLAIFTIRQTFLQVLASVGSDPVVKTLTRILLNDFDGRYHPTIEGQLNYTRDVAVGHGNRYIAIHPYFFKASFLDPRTHHYLKKILTVENFNEVRLIINSAVHHHHETLVHIISPTLFSSYIHMQLKTDILNEAILSISPSASDLANPNDSEAFSDNNLAQTNMMNDVMLDNLLASISDDPFNVTNGNHDDQEGDTTKKQCENELYQLLLGTKFKMKMQNVESKVYNCPLSWWKSSAGRYMNLGKLVIKYLAVPATSAPSERIWSRAARVLTVKRNRMKEDVTAAMMYCRENKHILHKHYTEIAKESMHEGDHHLIAKHKALLHTFEDEDDDNSESKIDAGFEVD